MTKCVIKICRNYKGRLKTTNKVTFHRIPKDRIMKKAWLDIISRSRDDVWVPAKTSVICSEHFKEKDFVINEKRRRLKKNAIPSKALFISSVKSDESENSDEDEILSGKKSSATSEDSSAAFIYLPDASIPQPDIETSAAKTNCNEDVDGDSSDLDSIYDSPMEAKLRKALRRIIVLERKHRLLIQCLRKKNQRLQKKVASFKNIIQTLKKNKDT